MILLWLIVVPFIGGLLAWTLARRDPLWARWTSLAAITADLVIAIVLWVQHRGDLAITGRGPWLVDYNHPWITALGIRFHLAMDGLSLLLVVLTAFLGIMAVAASWTEITERVGFFHFQLMWVLSGIVGVFLALDLFLFYFFWEMMLVPMYFLIAMWGHEHRVYASVKFFLFTQLSGLLMLLAILGLYFVHGRQTGVYTFDYFQLLGTPMAKSTAMWLMLGFLAAFAVKLPVVPLHTWLPDAHTEAPTAGSVVLAGLLLKTGAYGLLRFVVPLFPGAASTFRLTAMALAITGILYGALLAFGQRDLKRLVAYTSVSHMGFVLLGVFVGNSLALQGAVITIICHGLATGGLFILVGALQERTHTRDIRRMSGLWATVPRMGGVAMVLAMGALALPGLGNFVGEILVLFGTYQRNAPVAGVASLGMIAATVYALWIIQSTFHGPNREGWQLPDLGARELAMMGAMIGALIWLGVYPQPVLDAAASSLQSIQTRFAAAPVAPQALSPRPPLPILGEGENLSPPQAWAGDSTGATLSVLREREQMISPSPALGEGLGVRASTGASR
jgi:NADH-quinone oxidoreductase subunit M